MDIGTDKPPLAEMSAFPHHLFNIINPNEDFGLAQYQELAYRNIRDIHERHKMPLLVGGSGQYIWAVLEGWEIPHIPPDPEFRKTLEDLAAKNGIDGLYQQLQEIDPSAAQKIDKRNIRRVIRALEVSKRSGTLFSQLQRKKVPDYHTLIIGLTTDRKELYHRIDSRVDLMLQQGLVAEVKNLIQMGYDYKLPAMNSIGYKQIGMMLRGEINPDEAANRIKVDNHRFVRHQYAWFRLKDKRIHWFDVWNDFRYEVMELISDHLNIHGEE
jgi:tRNA dimethylallyltransferase